jgi:hypothetical protein
MANDAADHDFRTAHLHPPDPAHGPDLDALAPALLRDAEHDGHVPLGRDQLGHKDIKTTQRYAHLAPDVLMAAARGTPGSAANMPAACPRSTTRIVQAPRIIGRATLDSNQWPSAPEAEGISQISRESSFEIDPRACRGHVEAREVHERAQAALEAIASGDRFAVRRAIEALDVARDFAADILTGEPAPVVDLTTEARRTAP